MAVQTGPQATGTPSYASYEEERGHGWVLFAGILLLTLGAFNIIDGITAISRSHFYVGNAHYVFGDLRAWGWVALCIGAVQLLVGVGVFARNQLARWVGVAALALNAIAALLYMPSHPFWSLAIFAIDIVAIYGLVAYGQHISD